MQILNQTFTKPLVLKVFFIGLFIFQLANINTKIVLSQTPFYTSVKSEYIIDNRANTSVNHKVHLENKTSSTYASEYAFEISSVDIKNLTIKGQNQENLRFYTSISDTTTTINLEFDQPVVGKGRANDFTISYIQADLAQKDGQVLEVSIPKIVQIDSIDEFEVSLLVHNSFPTHFDINPTPNSESQTNEYRIYIFTDKSSFQQGLHAIFGNKQVMSFTLNYHLENPTVNNGITQITLPPDTAYQKLYYETITPKPDKIVTDGDGNWIATYILKPKDQVSVIAKGFVEIFLEPTVPVPTYNKNINQYLAELPYWQVTDPEIQKLAVKLKTPQSIYDYLVDNFSYNYNRLDVSSGRLGAVEALNNPDQVLCQEFTDAFIAIARAAGIPSREHNGYAYTQNPQVRPLGLVKDILHSWPEYFDIQKQAWIPIDPTWANTTGGMDYFNKIDLNHFTFVLHGLDSTSPYPVGYFKGDNTYDKDILVEFTDQTPEEKGNLELNIQLNFLHLFGLPFPANLHIKNNSNTAFHKKDLNIQSTKWEINWSDRPIESVLPFTDTSLPLLIKSPSLFYTKSEVIKIDIGNKNYELKIQNTQKDQIFFGLFILSMGGVIAVIALITRSILVYKRKR